MTVTRPIYVLAAVGADGMARYQNELADDPKLSIRVVNTESEARAALSDDNRPIDVLVIDQALGGTFEFIKELRETIPRLFIILVDEEADFGMPGRADEVSTEPFRDHDLSKKIKRLAEERQLATLRADALPAVRTFAKTLRKATKGLGRQKAALDAIQELTFDYVAYYSIQPTTPPALSLSIHAGTSSAMGLAPQRMEYVGLMGYVAETGQTKIVNRGEEPTYFMLERGLFSVAIACAVGASLRFGVMLACREQPIPLKGDTVLMTELVCAQLAAALAKDQRA